MIIWSPYKINKIIRLRPPFENVRLYIKIGKKDATF